MNIIGIDPGLSATGVACLIDGNFLTATIRSKKHFLSNKVKDICNNLNGFLVSNSVLVPECWDMLVIEMPQIYSREKSKGDPNGIAKLAVLVGAIAVSVSANEVLLPRPVQWKGSVPKRIHHRRILRDFPDLNRCSSDALDAVGLCLYGKKKHAHAKIR